MPKVSVIIPVYNNETYLSEAIESVLDQTYRDFEIIVVDDGSTDGSGGTARRYAGTHPGRITYVRQENRGPGAARNTGLRRSGGEYVAFLDADDIWKEAKLERQAALLDREPGVGMVYTGFYFIDVNRLRLERAGFRLYGMPKGDVTLNFFDRYFMFTSTVMMRRAVAERAGGFREDIFVGEDFDYLLRASLLCRVESMEDQLLVKRSRDDSLSSSDALLNLTNDLVVLTDFIRDNGAFYRAHRKEVDRRMGERCFALGYGLLKQGARRRAFPCLRDSLRYAPSCKAVRCIVQTALPARWVGFVRKLVRGAEPPVKLQGGQ